MLCLELSHTHASIALPQYGLRTLAALNRCRDLPRIGKPIPSKGSAKPLHNVINDECSERAASICTSSAGVRLITPLSERCK